MLQAHVDKVSSNLQAVSAERVAERGGDFIVHRSVFICNGFSLCVL